MFKKWALPGKSSTRAREEESLTMVNDLMVKDPFCGTYFPKKKGIKSVIKGKTYYFCSSACRDEYLEATKDSKHGVTE